MTSKKITVGNTPKVKLTLDAKLKFIQGSASSITDKHAPEGFNVPQQVIDNVKAGMAKPDELRRYHEWEIYHSADTIRERIDSYYLALEDGDSEEASISLFQAGYWMGRLHMLDSENELWRDFHVKLTGSENSLKGKEKVREQLRQALRIAENNWKSGDERWHHAMAKDLCRIHDLLTENQLKRELKPIAKKYNRLFGVRNEEADK